MSEKGENSTDHQKRISLDLGLSTLIDNASKSISVEGEDEVRDTRGVAEVLKHSAQLAFESELQPVSETEEASDPDAHLPDYEELSKSKRWAELASQCEKQMAKTGESDYESKLWWVKSQHAESKIPVSILAGSLESASAALLDARDSWATSPRKGKLAGMAAVLLKEFAFKLQREKDYELALLFAERSFRIDGSCRDELKKIVKEQISLAETESGTLSDAHKQSLKRVGIEFMLNGSGSHLPKDEGPPRAVSENSDESSYLRSKTREIFIGLSALALIIYGAYLAIGLGSSFFEGVSSSEVQLTPSLEIENAALLPVVSAPFPELLGGLTHLDAVYYDFNKIKGSDPAEVVQPVMNSAITSDRRAPAQPSMDSAAAASSGQEVSQRGTLPQRAPSQSGSGKEVVNTSSPVIAPEFPRFEPDDDSENDIPTIEFPPFRQKPRSGMAANSRADSRDDSFGAPRRYVVIAKTKVMEDPSYYAYSPADLYEGDEIQVEADLGKWLRIRTRRGTAAYVLSQDARPAARR
ncbi:MAG: hypothetical protein J5J00_13030 [Deltaproteobacteria bacterium]|nr:hypothetical protein [Deltaproteobacteria bacterium]